MAGPRNPALGYTLPTVSTLLMGAGMNKPFDTATKHLLETDPLAWLHIAGLPGTSATLRDSNLTTLTADADRVLWVEGEPGGSYLADIEPQSTHEEDGDERVFLYAAL